MNIKDLREKYKNNSQGKKDDNLLLGSHLESRSKAGEENTQQDKPVHVDNHPDNKSNFKTWIIIILLGFLITFGIYVWMSYEGKFTSSISQNQTCGVCPSIPSCPAIPVCPDCNPPSCPSINFSCSNININLNQT